MDSALTPDKPPPIPGQVKDDSTTVHLLKLSGEKRHSIVRDPPPESRREEHAAGTHMPDPEKVSDPSARAHSRGESKLFEQRFPPPRPITNEKGCLAKVCDKIKACLACCFPCCCKQLDITSLQALVDGGNIVRLHQFLTENRGEINSGNLASFLDRFDGNTYQKLEAMLSMMAEAGGILHPKTLKALEQIIQGERDFDALAQSKGIISRDAGFGGEDAVAEALLDGAGVLRSFLGEEAAAEFTPERIYRQINLLFSQAKSVPQIAEDLLKANFSKDEIIRTLEDKQKGKDIQEGALGIDNFNLLREQFGLQPIELPPI